MISFLLLSFLIVPLAFSAAILHTMFFCRAETIRSALEVLVVCTVIPKAQLQLCEQVRQPDVDPLPAIRFLFAFIVALFTLT